jgi:hypothetical protein
MILRLLCIWLVFIYCHRWYMEPWTWNTKWGCYVMWNLPQTTLVLQIKVGYTIPCYKYINLIITNCFGMFVNLLAYWCKENFEVVCHVPCPTFPFSPDLYSCRLNSLPRNTKEHIFSCLILFTQSKIPIIQGAHCKPHECEWKIFPEESVYFLIW